MPGRRAQILGYGQTDFERAEAASVIDLGAAAATQAMDVANIEARELQALFLGTFASLPLGGQAFPAAVLAARVGLEQAPALALEGACASGSIAFRQAVTAIEGGSLDVALVVGAEKMSGHPTDVVTSTLARANDTASESYLAGLTFPGFFALLAQRYLHDYDVDRDLLAHVSVKNRANGARNAHAHFQTPVSLSEAIGARPIADPLRLFDCSPISDGGAALVVASSEWAAAHGADAPVDVLAVAQATGAVSPEQMTGFTGLPAAARAATDAYAASGVSPADVDVAEVHDCFSIAEWLALEDLGAFERGEAAAATGDGATAPTGQLPVNTSGGLLAKGHPIGATGVAQLIEITRQLREEADVQVAGAELGVCHNVGGTGGTAVVSVLGRAA